MINLCLKIDQKLKNQLIALTSLEWERFSNVHHIGGKLLHMRIGCIILIDFSPRWHCSVHYYLNYCKYRSYPQVSNAILESLVSRSWGAECIVIVYPTKHIVGILGQCTLIWILQTADRPSCVPTFSGWHKMEPKVKFSSALVLPESSVKLPHSGIITYMLAIPVVFSRVTTRSWNLDRNSYSGLVYVPWPNLTWIDGWLAN